jgi:hypothetical protein
MSDEETRDSGNVRRVTAKNRKERLDYGHNLFPAESPLSPDPRAVSAQDADEPLPFDAATAFSAPAERFPPLPFDGEDPVSFAAQEAEAERFPPLPPPGWARTAAQHADPVETFELESEPMPAPVAKSGRSKAQKAAPRQQTSKGRGCLYNLLTLLFLVLTVAALLYGVYLFQNPYSTLNPLPPPTSLPIIITATAQPPTDVPPPTTEAFETLAPVDTTLATPEPTPTVEAQPTATYTPLPPEILTELAPGAPTPEAGG